MTVPRVRRKQVSYGTKLISIPLPLEAQVKVLKSRYKLYWKATGNVDNPPCLLGTEKEVRKYRGKKLKGGKNQEGQPSRAPYQIKLVRVPIPLAEQVNDLILRYMGYIQAGGNVDTPIDLLGIENLPDPPFPSSEPEPPAPAQEDRRIEYLDRFDRIVTRFEIAVNKLIQFSEQKLKD
ncbi:MAG: hypothetical protein QNJ38_22350 [Prochloraceae cyanobacterium]|nr:hypothetical protein [Prochloraceae cyanobacterium]